MFQCLGHGHLGDRLSVDAVDGFSGISTEMTRGAARCCVPRMEDHKDGNMKIYIQKKRKAKAKSKEKQ